MTAAIAYNYVCIEREQARLVRLSSPGTRTVRVGIDDDGCDEQLVIVTSRAEGTGCCQWMDGWMDGCNPVKLVECDEYAKLEEACHKATAGPSSLQALSIIFDHLLQEG